MDKSDLEHFTSLIQRQNSIMCTEMMLSHGKCKADAKKALFQLNEAVSTLKLNISVLDKNTFGHVPTRKEMLSKVLGSK